MLLRGVSLTKRVGSDNWYNRRTIPRSHTIRYPAGSASCRNSEVDALRNRCGHPKAAGIAKAQAKGLYKGRPVTLDHDQIRAMRSQGLGATAIAKQLGCSR